MKGFLKLYSYPIITVLLCIYPIAAMNLHLPKLLTFIITFVLIFLSIASPILGSLIPSIAYIVAVVQCFTEDRIIGVTILTLILATIFFGIKIFGFIVGIKNKE